MKHTFAIAAYGDSPYLESCIRSLEAQSVSSGMILCTSTPSDYIEMLASKYGIPYHVREGEPGIGRDWNYAYEKAETELVTIAHQDDMYHHDYAKTVLEAKEKYPDMSLFTCASETVRNGRLMKPGKVEIVKKILRLPLRINEFNNLTGIKKAAISLGNPIICPSCTYDRELCGPEPFNTDYEFVLDWDFLYRLAQKKGRWVCSELPLIMYRVHGDAATGESIKSHVREKEESMMFDRLLPGEISDAVKTLYKKSYAPYEEEIEREGR